MAADMVQGLAMIVALMAGFLALEAMAPARKLHHVPGWWVRVLVIHIFQIAVIAVGVHAWEPVFRRHLLLDASFLQPVVGGMLAYVTSTFIFCKYILI